MRNNSNTILITGGGTGIGRGLAEAFHRLGNRVIIGGRREAVLKDACAANPGMSYVVLDTRDAASIKAAAEAVIADVPGLNCVINNAGLQRVQDFTAAGNPNDTAIVEEIETNLLGVLRMCAAFIPHLRGQEEAYLINVTSGLAFVPMARVPVYCATKAAVHSFTVSLRHQLRDTTVKVIELVPPWVDTDLDKGRRRPPGPQPMPLPQFIAEAMEGLSGDSDEVVVADAKFLHASGAAPSEAFTKAFSRLNP
jgi:uncharacterized oxidoreductase